MLCIKKSLMCVRQRLNNIIYQSSLEPRDATEGKEQKEEKASDPSEANKSSGNPDEASFMVLYPGELEPVLVSFPNGVGVGEVTW